MQNRKGIYDALVLKYKAQQQKAKTNLKVYFLGVVGVAEHPDVVDTVDKLLKEYAEATELLKILEENFDELAENTRLL